MTWLKTQPKARLFQITTSALALFGLLAYTFVHTGDLLSRYIEPQYVGYLAAFSIEISIVSLSVRIGELRKTGQNPYFFAGVLITVLFVSTIANTSEGYRVNQGKPLEIDTFQIDWVQGIIGLAATALIPLIIFALSEIIGTDVSQTVQAIERKRKADERQQANIVSTTEPYGHFPMPIEQARAIKAWHDANAKEERMDIMVDILSNQPHIKPTELTQLLNISRTTVYDYLNEMTNSGIIKKNGNGWEVYTVES